MNILTEISQKANEYVREFEVKPDSVFLIYEKYLVACEEAGLPHLILVSPGLRVHVVCGLGCDNSSGIEICKCYLSSD